MMFLRMVGGPYDRWEIPDDKSDIPPRSWHFAGLPDGFSDAALSAPMFTEKRKITDAPPFQRFDYMLDQVLQTPAGGIAIYLYAHPSVKAARFR